MFGLTDPRQIRNGRAVLFAVYDYCQAQGYSKAETRRAARLAIMCCMTESNLWQYANHNVPESLSIPHEQVGSDHASVGLYQQQVPSWGTARQCMDIGHSTRHFLRALRDKGELPPYQGRPLWERVQAVQVSAYADGSNYRRNRARSWAFLARYWNFTTGAPRGKRV